MVCASWMEIDIRNIQVRIEKYVNEYKMVLTNIDSIKLDCRNDNNLKYGTRLHCIRPREGYSQLLSKSANDSYIFEQTSQSLVTNPAQFPPHSLLYCWYSVRMESSSSNRRERIPKSVIFSTKRESTTQLVDLRLPWTLISVEWSVERPCGGNLS